MKNSFVFLLLDSNLMLDFFFSIVCSTIGHVSLFINVKVINVNYRVVIRDSGIMGYDGQLEGIFFKKN